jgi:tRNA nucleotidyltransferase (CCA-adding enzyme)
MHSGLRWLAEIDSSEKAIEHWLFILETLLLNLTPAECEQAMKQLHLPETSQLRLQWLWHEATHLQELLLTQDRPSEIAQHLQYCGVPQLVHLAMGSTIPVRAKLWRYLTRWRNRSPLLNGKDLLQLGYRAGPAFKTVLEAVHAATLDGELSDKPAAIAFVQTHFPEFRSRADA